MTPKHFVAVCLRLFALWLIFSGIQFFFIATALKYFNAQLSNGPMWIFVAVWAVFLVVAFLLWILSAPLATGLLAGVPKPQTPSLSLGDVIVAGCVLMGLWWLKEALGLLVGLWLKTVALSDLGDQSVFVSLGSTGKISTGIYLAEIAVGLFFVTRPFSIAKWVMRSAPTSRVESTEKQSDGLEEHD
ncbi:hypothetical protein [Dyella lipolytica]|uniref:Uncharacterized protein n=1 Tax=Dyella lipolytica TaxID=1867835 RepID=A0ABW8ITF4_9GAMM|nr:hypothetical protein [Dyella lipolytica]